MLHWFIVICACVFGAGCAHGEDNEPSNMDSGSTGGANDDPDAGGKSARDAGTAPSPIDQTPPLNANGLTFDAVRMIDVDGEFFVTGFDKPTIAVINPDGSHRTVLHVGTAPDDD